MIIRNLILAFLCGYSESRRRLWRIQRGMDPVRFSKLHNNLQINKSTLSVTLTRLKSLGLIKNENGLWSANQKGRKFFLKILKKDRAVSERKLHNIYSGILKGQSKNMIVIFDIPEKKRTYRDWLRIELVALGFIQLQKSVWFGPSPLPEKFIEAVNNYNLLQYLKFFVAKEHEII